MNHTLFDDTEQGGCEPVVYLANASTGPIDGPSSDDRCFVYVSTADKTRFIATPHGMYSISIPMTYDEAARSAYAARWHNLGFDLGSSHLRCSRLAFSAGFGGYLRVLIGDELPQGQWGHRLP